MLEFKDGPHKYFVGTDQYVSVTTIIDKYKIEFDTDFWSTYKALEKLIGVEEFRKLKQYKDWKSPAFIEWCSHFVNMNDLLREIQWYRDKWDAERNAALDKGSHYHNVKEKQAYDEGYEINPFTRQRVTTMMKKPRFKDKTSISSDLSTLPDGYYPELMMWNDEFKVAGTADKVFIETIKKKRFIDIDDFKTNKLIKKENPYQKMKEPIGSLDDCNFNHYRIQICLYAWIMSEFGFTVRNVAFTHFNETHKLSYGRTRRHIINLLKHYDEHYRRANRLQIANTNR